MCVSDSDSESEDEGITIKDIWKQVDEIAVKGGTVNNVFMPAKDGFMGHGKAAFLYKGQKNEWSENIHTSQKIL